MMSVLTALFQHPEQRLAYKKIFYFIMVFSLKTSLVLKLNITYCLDQSFASLTLARDIWEEDPQLRKRLYQIVCRQVSGALS